MGADYSRMTPAEQEERTQQEMRNAAQKRIQAPVHLPFAQQGRSDAPQLLAALKKKRQEELEAAGLAPAGSNLKTTTASGAAAATPSSVTQAPHRSAAATPHALTHQLAAPSVVVAGKTVSDRCVTLSPPPSPGVHSIQWESNAGVISSRSSSNLPPEHKKKKSVAQAKTKNVQHKNFNREDKEASQAAAPTPSKVPAGATASAAATASAPATADPIPKKNGDKINAGGPPLTDGFFLPPSKTQVRSQTPTASAKELPSAAATTAATPCTAPRVSLPDAATRAPRSAAEPHPVVPMSEATRRRRDAIFDQVKDVDTKKTCYIPYPEARTLKDIIQHMVSIGLMTEAQAFPPELRDSMRRERETTIDRHPPRCLKQPWATAEEMDDGEAEFLAQAKSTPSSASTGAHASRAKTHAHSHSAPVSSSVSSSQARPVRQRFTYPASLASMLAGDDCEDDDETHERESRLADSFAGGHE